MARRCGVSTARNFPGCGWWPRSLRRPAWCWRNRGVRTSERDGELTTGRTLIASLDLAGRVITGDALYCQRDLSRTITDAGGDYLFTVKANQHELLDHLETVFALPPHDAVFQNASQRDRHGDRHEVRQLTATAELAGYLDWPGHAQVCRLERTVTRRGKPPSSQVRYAITSLTDDAATLLVLWRGHWGIENQLHYVRDVTGGEDASQVRTGSGPQIMAALRNTSLALLRNAGWNNMAAAHRHVAWTPGEPLRLLGITP